MKFTKLGKYDTTVLDSTEEIQPLEIVKKSAFNRLDFLLKVVKEKRPDSYKSFLEHLQKAYANFAKTDYYVDNELTMPEGFCKWAWIDIYRDVAIISKGGTFAGGDLTGTKYSCCSDGLKPVVFFIERIDG